MSTAEWATSLQKQSSWSCFNFVAPIFSVPAEAKSDAAASESTPLDIFILAGQSNMAGRGGVVPTKEGLLWDGILPSKCRAVPGKVLRFSPNSTWEDATEPGHKDVDSTKICGVGPGLPFSKFLLEMGYPGTIGLVPCAIGGTDIDLWQEGSKLFTSTISRAKDALAARPNSRLAGILWYQGESDADTTEHADSYQQKLEALIGALRDALDSPLLPVIQVAIHSTRAEVPFVNKIRAAQFSAKIPAMVTVDAKGLELQDGFHLSTSAQCKLAREMAVAHMAKFYRPAELQMDAPQVDQEMGNMARP